MRNIFIPIPLCTACGHYACRYKEDIGITEYTINQTVDEILMDIYRTPSRIFCVSPAICGIFVMWNR